MAYCTNCGTDLASGVSYCASCGTAASPEMSSTSADLPPAAYYGAPGASQTPASGLRAPVDAVSTCFSKYVDFSGRATRAEFWWWVLIMEFVVPVLGLLMYPEPFPIVMLATFLPGIAVAARRLHDIDKSGWWQLIGFVPLIGWLVLIIFYAKRGSPGTNSYGPPA